METNFGPKTGLVLGKCQDNFGSIEMGNKESWAKFRKPICFIRHTYLIGAWLGKNPQTNNITSYA